MSKLIRIKYYESPIEANRDKQILLENGIESFIANEQTIQSDWLLSQAIGGLQLQVFEEDVEKAKEILKNFEENEEVALEVEHTIENPEYDFTCPKCNQPRIIGQYTINNWDNSFHPDSNLKDIIKNYSIKYPIYLNVDSIIDKLYSNGATTVSNVTFKSEDIQNVDTQLRKKVFQDAKDKASRIAKSSGKRLGKIISITDDGTSNTSSIKDMQSGDGLISISKSVSVVYQLK